MKSVPCEKLSRKKKRESERQRRLPRGALSLVTRRPGSPKACKRSRARLSDEGEAFSLRNGIGP